MNVIAAMIDRLNKIDLTNNLPRLIEETAPELLEKNKSQLRGSVLATGARIMPEYQSGYYSKLKAQLNPLPGYGHPDLLKTGSFYQGIGIVVTQKSIIFDSSDSKAAKLETLYGSQIYGLDDKSKSEYALTVLLPKIRQHIRDTAGI